MTEHITRKTPIRELNKRSFQELRKQAQKTLKRAKAQEAEDIANGKVWVIDSYKPFQARLVSS